jgi:Trk-type K+ transport system membrane component
MQQELVDLERRVTNLNKRLDLHMLAWRRFTMCLATLGVVSLFVALLIYLATNGG